MQKAILISAVMFVGICLSQERHAFFEQKTVSTGVPFEWPQTWADASNSSIKREDVLRLLIELRRDDIVPVYAIQSFRFVPLEKSKFYLGL
jgi:hypothetical protein